MSYRHAKQRQEQEDGCQQFMLVYNEAGHRKSLLRCALLGFKGHVTKGKTRDNRQVPAATGKSRTYCKTIVRGSAEQAEPESYSSSRPTTTMTHEHATVLLPTTKDVLGSLGEIIVPYSVRIDV